LKMKIIIAFVFACALVLGAHAVSTRENPSGSCGENATYNLDLDTGVLTISGVGGVQNYSCNKPGPWYQYRNSITKVVIEEGITSTGAYAFSNTKNLVSIQLPSSLIYLVGASFFNCTGLPSLDVPEGVRFIGMGAFDGCRSLTSVSFPASVVSVGIDLFLDAHKVVEVKMHPDNPYYHSEDGVLYDKEMHTIISYPPGKRGTYTIPSSVVAIPSFTFQDCVRLGGLVIHEKITEIGEFAFYGCSDLESFEVSASNPVFETKDGVIYYRQNHSLFRYPPGRKGKITVPSYATTIGDYSFNRCHGLTSVIIPSTITSIGKYAFLLCKNLTSILIPASVTSIPDDVFDLSDKLKYVSYLGTSDPSVPSFGSVFPKTALICVPEAYSSSTFCSRNITCKSSRCDAINSQCVDLVNKSEICEVVKKEEATQWEKKSNDCVEYYCDEKFGLVSKSLCENGDNTAVCQDDKCVAAEEKKWAVVIEFDTDKVESETYDAIVGELKNTTGIDTPVVVEYDDNGVIKSVTIYVDDKDQAEKITDIVNSLDKGESCAGVLCSSKQATMKDTTLSFASTYYIPTVLILLSIVLSLN